MTVRLKLLQPQESLSFVIITLLFSLRVFYSF